MCAGDDKNSFVVLKYIFSCQITHFFVHSTNLRIPALTSVEQKSVAIHLVEVLSGSLDLKHTSMNYLIYLS